MSDTHELHREVDVPDGDILIHAGDFTMFSGSLSAVEDFNLWLGELPYRSIISAGNHEFFLERDPSRRTFLSNTNVLINESIDLYGLKIWGSPVTPLANAAFGISSAEDRRWLYSQISDDTDVLITHGPPYGILDSAPVSQFHSGCRELFDAVMRVKPLHQLVVIDVIETALDIPLDDPLVGCPLASAIFCRRSRTHAHADMLQGAVAASSGPKPVRHMPEASLEDRLQDILDRALNYAVTHGRDTEGSELPRLTRLGISFRREGLGLYRPFFRSPRSCSRNNSIPIATPIPATVIPSTPAVRRPLFRAIFRQAHRRLRMSVIQSHTSR